jgi:hypothetical protein
MKFFFYSILVGISLVIAFTVSNPTVNNLALGIAGGAILLLIDTLIVNAKWLRYMWWSIRYFNTTVRLSVSYLFRIKVDDQYFLVRGVRIKDQFQPVGGVYKRYKSSESFFSQIGALDDDLFPIDESSKNDLRLRIKGRNLLQFIRWFYSEQDRERDPWREFYEELIETGIIRSEEFPYLFTKKIKQYVSGVAWSDYVQSKELFIADIYEPILSDKQYSVISKLMDNSSAQYIFATEEQIKRLGIIPKKQAQANISKTASWML